MEASKNTYKDWLTNEYRSPKAKGPLKEDSSNCYISGIRSIEKALGLSEHYLYKMILKDLLDIRTRVYKLEISNKKDKQSHFEALIKFREYYEKFISINDRYNIFRQTDIDIKRKVEYIAIETTRDYYETREWQVTSVEDENYGWDLIISNKKEELFVEVKGLSGRKVSIELSPNE